MGFPSNVSERALVASGRRCCLCHKFCGMKMELHHIDQVADGGEDTFDNCIPLCFDCHADVKAYNPRHPKGKSFSISELKAHRDAWYSKVSGSGLIETNVAYKNEDRETYRKVLELLPMDGAIYFFRDHHFASSFKTEKFDDFNNFLHWAHKRPDFEFIDSDLESMRSCLVGYIEDFLGYMAYNTDPKDDCDGVNEVPWMLEMENPAKYNEKVKNLNDKMTLVTNLYDDFIRTARRKLFAD